MTALLYFLGFSVALNLLLYVIAYLLQTDKITDISYSLTFLIIAVSAYYLSEGSLVDLLLLLAIGIWAIRLGTYLFYRILKIGHDSRFDSIRKNPISFLFFWIMQGLTCGIVSFGVILAMQNTSKEMHALFFMGLSIALSGWLIETIADIQKFKFKLKYPKAFMNKGLWARLRHPNYTGELLYWWGIFVACLPYANPWLALISPLWISLIIIKFSGISILNETWQEKYGDNVDFQEYKKQSWALIPYLY